MVAEKEVEKKLTVEGGRWLRRSMEEEREKAVQEKSGSWVTGRAAWDASLREEQPPDETTTSVFANASGIQTEG